MDNIRSGFEERKNNFLGGKFKKMTWTPLVDNRGNNIPQGEFQERVMMLGPQINKTGAPVHIAIYEDRPVVVKMSKVSTELAYNNPPMDNELRKALNIQRLAPGISTPHVTLAAPYPMKTTKMTNVMMMVDYRICSLGDLINELSKHPSDDFKWEMLRKIASKGFDLLEHLITRTNYVHRDIKPDNILIRFTSDDDFEMELTDFGITIESGIRVIFPVGTPFFSAREQQSPEKKDRRATWLWDLEGWVLSVVGMAADLGLIPQPGFKTPGLKPKDYHKLKVGFFRDLPEMGPLMGLVIEAERIIFERTLPSHAKRSYEILKTKI